LVYAQVGKSRAESGIRESRECDGFSPSAVIFPTLGAIFIAHGGAQLS
jgi:hypothetical protein